MRFVSLLLQQSIPMGNRKISDDVCSHMPLQARHPWTLWNSQLLAFLGVPSIESRGSTMRQVVSSNQEADFSDVRIFSTSKTCITFLRSFTTVRTSSWRTDKPYGIQKHICAILFLFLGFATCFGGGDGSRGGSGVGVGTGYGAHCVKFAVNAVACRKQITLCDNCGWPTWRWRAAIWLRRHDFNDILVRFIDVLRTFVCLGLATMLVKYNVCDNATRVTRVFSLSPFLALMFVVFRSRASAITFANSCNRGRLPAVNSTKDLCCERNVIWKNYIIWRWSYHVSLWSFVLLFSVYRSGKPDVPSTCWPRQWPIIMDMIPESKSYQYLTSIARDKTTSTSGSTFRCQ